MFLVQNFSGNWQGMRNLVHPLQQPTADKQQSCSIPLPQSPNNKVSHMIHGPFHFSSVAHVWVPGVKTTGPIAKKFVFS
jgi:hypothetical protein